MKSDASHTPLESSEHQLDRIGHEPGKSRDTIAKVELIQVSSAGEKTPISFEIGTPYVTLDGFWRAPIWICGFGDPSPEIYGLDSMQALYLALERIRRDLFALAASGRLLDREGDEISPQEYFKAKN